MSKFYTHGEDDKFDFDLSESSWRIPTHEAWGKETDSLEQLDFFLNSKIEMKCQNIGIGTGNFFIEFEINPINRKTKEFTGFRKSGIQTTQSEFYVLTKSWMITIVPTRFLMHLHKNIEMYLRKYEDDGLRIVDSSVPNNPISKGYLIPFCVFDSLYSDWCRNPDFVQWLLKTREKIKSTRVGKSK